MDLSSSFECDDDGVVEMLANARALLDRAISNYGEQSVASVSSRTGRRGIIRDLVSNAQHEIKGVVSSSYFLDELTEMLDDLDFTTIGRHVITAAVCHVSTTDSVVLQGLIDAHGMEVRVARRDLPDMLIVDGRRAFTRLSSAQSDALFVFNFEMVKLLNAFYTEAWHSSIDIAAFRRLSHIYECGFTRRVIDQLARGHKDEVAARSMGMSVRTYRRHIAELMRDLNAQSRFQIGARLVQVGGFLSSEREWN